MLPFREFFQYLRNIPVQAQAPATDFVRAESSASVDAHIKALGIVPGPLPEGIFDDHRGIHPHTQFQIQDLLILELLEEPVILPSRPVPPGIFHKSIVTAQVHHQR